MHHEHRSQASCTYILHPQIYTICTHWMLGLQPHKFCMIHKDRKPCWLHDGGGDNWKAQSSWHFIHCSWWSPIPRRGGAERFTSEKWQICHPGVNYCFRITSFSSLPKWKIFSVNSSLSIKPETLNIIITTKRVYHLLAIRMETLQCCEFCKLLSSFSE